MASFPVLSEALARRVERAIVREKLATLEPGKAQVGRFGEVVAIKVPGQPRLSGIYSLSERDLPRLEEIIAFYRSDGLKPACYVAPTGFTHEVGLGLVRAGFVPDSFSQAVLFSTGDAIAPEQHHDDGDIVVEPVTAETLEAYAQVNVEGFEYPQAWHENIKADLLRQFAARVGFFAYLVRFRGEVAGSGHFSAIDGVGNLGGTSVLPRFRGRGCHAALLRRRLRDAKAHGCELIVGGARFLSPSFRNQLRVGLQIAYIESGWKMA